MDLFVVVYHRKGDTAVFRCTLILVFFETSE